MWTKWTRDVKKTKSCEDLLHMCHYLSQRAATGCWRFLWEEESKMVLATRRQMDIKPKHCHRSQRLSNSPLGGSEGKQEVVVWLLICPTWSRASGAAAAAVTQLMEANKARKLLHGVITQSDVKRHIFRLGVIHTSLSSMSINPLRNSLICGNIITSVYIPQSTMGTGVP